MTSANRVAELEVEIPTTLRSGMFFGMTGEPRVIVRDGEILHRNMRWERMTAIELESEMRLAGIGTIEDVAWAILEPNGKISFVETKAARSEQQDKAESA